MKNWLTCIAIPIAVSVTAALGGAAGPASAGPPAPYPAEKFDMRTVFKSACPNLEVTAQLTGKTKDILLKRDRIVSISPGATITLTANKKSLTYLITGTAHVQILPDGGREIRSTGKNLLIVPEVPGKHLEGLFYTTGNKNYALDKDGNETRLFSGPGQVVNVCDLLK